MNTNIQINNIKKHFLTNDEIENNEDLKKNDLFKTKIKIYSFYSKNEVNICDKIKLIPYYSNYYMIIEDYDYINITQLNGTFIEKLNLKNDNKNYNFVINDWMYLIDNDSLINISTIKKFGFKMATLTIGFKKIGI